MKEDGNTPAGATLVVTVRDALRRQIQSGEYKPGDRLPSESRLTQDFGVSRTVVREAIAALRADGIVEPKQGAGVFVLPAAETSLPFREVDTARVSSIIEILELRTALEGDAAALAALRHSPAQEEAIIEAYHRLTELSRAGEPTSEADFAFHLAIAQATNNPRFSEILQLIGIAMIPRRMLAKEAEVAAAPDYSRMLEQEHGAILAAIQNADPEAAAQAMRQHLKNSQTRYRQQLRDARPTP
ncbi:FadR/GntR family transcriptional regulator [Paracoccus sp. MBLB3053]|uniref:FadR/GntR family transcriptional regulator n=1 Tax=Paracoccus aurantius TaxID=3073814 RepID=A0ABU2HS56_9RHOB|nr:FadR/GntR family transcriptional regulator [Paracoccus sp. MBLB3053]MDS9467439.1 FadR/GntR family transcriptional regulator [Paracoccus sp. MBLB3053]